MRCTREELEAAHDRYQARSEACVRSGDWHPYGEQFTEDAVYVEHFMGTFEGRRAITDWIVESMASTDPGWSFPLEWRMFDEDRGQVIFAAWNVLPDVDGNGPYRFISWSLVDYAGDDQWSRQEDLYDTGEMTRVYTAWNEAKATVDGAG
ncbi:MAG TPA: nuclear transport factor 2 family protein [Acidimicrobiales bacterium]|nr:nuclear transport factor 2 family protein [Acidimicrobiales bacterium]